jgi:hypothetical protein
MTHRSRLLHITFVIALPCLAAGCWPSPDVKVGKVTEMGVINFTPLVQGRDGGESALLWGHSVWNFGDTVLNVPDVDGRTWHHNSFSITSDLDASNGLTGFDQPLDAAGAPAYFIAPTDEEAEFNTQHYGDDGQCPAAKQHLDDKPCGARWAVWPGGMVYDAARDRVLVFYGLIYAEPGDFNFHGVGQSLAVWKGLDQVPERPVLSPGSEHPTVLFPENEPDFGLGPQIIGDDLYAFSCIEGPIGRPCLLGRVPLEHALERDAWRFYDGSGWSPNYGDARWLFSGAPIMSVAWNAFLGRYIAVYAPSLFNQVVMRTAPALEGPWSEETVLFNPQHHPDQGGTAYDAMAHAELAEDSGRVQYVTFSRSNGMGWFGSEFALVRVELEKPAGEKPEDGPTAGR